MASAKSTAGGRRGCRWPNTPSGIDRRVELAELDPGLGRGEAPVGRDPGAVPVPLPRRHVAPQRRPVADPLRQVAGERAELDLSHVESRAVPGRGGDLERGGTTPIPAFFIPEPSLGVWWTSSRSARRLARSGGKVDRCSPPRNPIR